MGTKQGTIRARMIVTPIAVYGSTTTPSNGGLNPTGQTGASFGPNAQYLLLDPFAIGGRFAVHANIYQQYKINACTIRFRSDLSSIGMPSNNGAATTTASYAIRKFALGFARDPAFVPANFLNALELGARIGSTDRDCSVKCGSSPWLFCSLPGGASFSDIRQCMFGEVFLIFDTSTTATTPAYGYIDFELDVSFRLPTDNPVVHATEPEQKETFYQRIEREYADRKKPPDSPVVVSNPSSKRK